MLQKITNTGTWEVTMNRLLRIFAPLGVVLALVAPVSGAELLILSEDVPAGLDFDGPSGSLIDRKSVV